MLGVGFDTLWNRYEKEKAEEERINALVEKKLAEREKKSKGKKAEE